MKHIQFALCLMLILAACRDEGPMGPPQPPVPPGVTDLRTQYKVSTLTEPFDGSGDVAVDANGFLYVANFGDQLNNANGDKVTKVDPATGALSVFATGFEGASGNAFASNGDLFQASIRGCFISRITPDGQVSPFLTADVNGPVGMAFDPNDTLYVSNCNGNFISKISPNGDHTTFLVHGQLRCPNGMAIDPEGNIYPANFSDGKVHKVTPDGVLTLFATLPGGSCAHIEYWDDGFYVVGRGANQLYRLDMEGNISLLAGTGFSGNLDGSGEIAEFFIPNGLAVSPDGSKIYVIDRVVGVGPPLNPVAVRVVERK